MNELELRAAAQESGAAATAAAAEPADDDWHERFYLHAFLSLTLADRRIERRELVWIKSFFRRARKPQYYERLLVLVEAGGCDGEALAGLSDRAACDMSMAEKRRCIYSLAQMCKAKGGDMSDVEYENILDLAERIGVDETEADSIINSVFSINDTFTAIIGVLALGVALYFTRIVIIPLVIAIFVTMIVNRVEAALTATLRLHRVRWLSKIAAMVVVVGVMFLVAMAAVHSSGDVAGRMPYYEGKVAVLLGRIDAFAAEHDLRGLRPSALLERLQDLPFTPTLSRLLGSLVNLVANFVLVVIFVGFFTFSSRGGYEGILQEMNDKITAYVSVKTFSSFITGVAMYGLALAFGIDFALFWGVLGFLLNYIPSVGSIVASAPPILLAMIQLESPAAVVLFTALLVTTHVLIGQVLEPKIMGDKLAVKPVAILLGLIFWGFLWGIPGMFLAAPLMAFLRILASYFNFSRNFERLLAPD